MKLLFTLLFFASTCRLIHSQNIDNQIFINSPRGTLQLIYTIDNEGISYYSLQRGSQYIIKHGKMGLELKKKPNFYQGFRWSGIDSSNYNQIWQAVWGEESQLQDQHKRLVISLEKKETPGFIFKIEFKLYDDGLAFRYIIPNQEGLYHHVIKDEYTTFPLSGDHTCWWIPGDYDSNEFVYSRTRISEIQSDRGKSEDAIAFKTFVHDSLVQTPFTMITGDGLHLSIHEAGLYNFPAMQLSINRKTFEASCHLVPDPNGDKAHLYGESKLPWRVILVGNSAGDLLKNRIILHVNEPNQIENTEFIKPGKFVGVWWELHVGKSSWDYSSDKNTSKPAIPHGKHGANTANVKKYIDFASKYNIPYVLVEGWNQGWENWFGYYKDEVFDFTTPYPDFDPEVLYNYAKERKVSLIMHHETSASAVNYERRLDAALGFMKKFGYPAIKSGYVGQIIPRGEHHDGQWMVRHYSRVAEICAQNKIMIDMHEPVRPTGLHRTFPNWMACEAARGNEFNAWSSGNPPDHETILPFTRLLGGPMDYTPGIFEIKMNSYDPNKKEQVHTTLAKQLALYVTLYSPLQMLADLPENYEKHKDAFQFLIDVPVEWQQTEILEAAIGDYLSIARKDKNSSNWYIGAITDEQERIANISLDFLDDKSSYAATIYMDADNAHWQNNPMSYQITKKKVSKKDRFKIKLAAGGGCGIQLVKLD